MRSLSKSRHVMPPFCDRFDSNNVRVRESRRVEKRKCLTCLQQFGVIILLLHSIVFTYFNTSAEPYLHLLPCGAAACLSKHAGSFADCYTSRCFATGPPQTGEDHEYNHAYQSTLVRTTSSGVLCLLICD